MSSLHELGWNSFFQQYVQLGDTRLPARVIEEQRSAYRIATEKSELWAEVSGRLRRLAGHRFGLPAVGDWVLIDARVAEGRATIQEILPRKSKFSRKSAGNETAEQIIAANIDTVFLMTSLNADLNPRRIERYLTTIWDSGARPVILLSKVDLGGDIESALNDAAAIALGAPIHALSAVTGEGLDPVYEYLKPGQTAALLGSSGVGKSTLLNRLVGRDIQKVRDIRDDDARGRHTTTARRLFLLPGRGMLIDTPGLRELQLWDPGDGLLQTFDDIRQLAEGCRFRDCGHASEPDCAVQWAVENQELSPERFESYLKLRREQNHIARQQDVLARIEETRRWKRIHKAARENYKSRDKP